MGHPEENLNLGSDPAVPSSSQLHQALTYFTRSLGPLISKLTEHGHVLRILIYYLPMILSSCNHQILLSVSAIIHA
jgi:hypothetical protein